MIKVNIIKPKSLKEALELHRKIKKQSVYFLAGGTDLMLYAKDDKFPPSVFIDISKLKELQGIKKNKNRIFIGALSTHSDVEHNGFCRKYFPALSNAAGEVGAEQIKNRGTIGGNICNASPAGDTLTSLYVLNAQTVIRSYTGKTKKVTMAKFIKGPGKTVLRPGEILLGIEIPVDKKQKSVFRKIGPRKKLAISKVHAAIAGKIIKNKFHDVYIALGSVGPVIIKANKSAEYLNGKDADDNVIVKAAELAVAAACPIDDIRSTASYRNRLIFTLVKDLLYDIEKQ